MDITDNPAQIVPGGASVLNVSSGKYEGQRTPTWYACVQANGIGLTVLHTPAIGKRVRLLGLVCLISPLATSGAGVLVEIRDGPTTRIAVAGYCGTAAGIQPSVPISWGENGYLSTTAGQVLNINLQPGGFTAGECVVTAWGTEE